MSIDLLREGLGQFHEAFDKRLENMPPGEQQQFIEGAFLVLDSLTRFGGLDILEGKDGLSLPEFFEFLGTLKANVYSTAHHRKLDPDTYMKPLVESDHPTVAKATIEAARLHVLIGNELSVEQKMRVQQMAILCGIGLDKLPPSMQLI